MLVLPLPSVSLLWDPAILTIWWYNTSFFMSMTALSHGWTETLAAKERSAHLSHIRCGPERVHLSAQLLIRAFPGVRGPLSEQRSTRENIGAHLQEWPSIPLERSASGAGRAEGLKAGETFVINFLFSRTSQWTPDSREEMPIGLRVSWRRQELWWKLLDLLLLARQMESQQGSPAPR